MNQITTSLFGNLDDSTNRFLMKEFLNTNIPNMINDVALIIVDYIIYKPSFRYPSCLGLITHYNSPNIKTEVLENLATKLYNIVDNSDRSQFINSKGEIDIEKCQLSHLLILFDSICDRDFLIFPNIIRSKNSQINNWDKFIRESLQIHELDKKRPENIDVNKSINKLKERYN